MSKKKPVSAIDEFQPDGSFTRSLVFESPKGKTEIVPFPSDSMCVIRGPREVYDWYGRKVTLSKEISHIIHHYSSKTNGYLVDEAEELFLAKKKNGKQTLATLTMQRLYDKNHHILEPIKMSYFKQVRTGHHMNHQPIIIPGKYEFDRIDNSIPETPIMQAFLLGLPSYRRVREIDYFIGVKGGSLGQKNTYSVFRDKSAGFLTWMHNCFAENRNAIMDMPKESEPNHRTTNFLLGNITVSENGTKMSAICPVEFTINEEVHFKTISTDIEVVKHMYRKDGQYSLWWYFDGGEIKEPLTTP